MDVVLKGFDSLGVCVMLFLNLMVDGVVKLVIVKCVGILEFKFYGVVDLVDGLFLSVVKFDLCGYLLVIKVLIIVKGDLLLIIEVVM